MDTPHRLGLAVTLHVPFRLVKRGGRKEMQMPEGAPPSHKSDNLLVKALARAFRWKQMLETGEFATIAELAERERIAPSYMTRVLRLTLLAPEIVEAILDGKQVKEMTLARVSDREDDEQPCACAAKHFADPVMAVIHSLLSAWLRRHQVIR